MPVGEARDKKGNIHKFLSFNGKRFPIACNEDILRNIPYVNVRQDDVILCGYPRSGTHWMFEMIQMLQSGSAQTVPKWKGDQMLEFKRQNDLDIQRSPRVLNTHLYYPELPRDVSILGNKIVYLLRDPKDVAISYYRMYVDMKGAADYNGDLDSFLDMYISGEVHWGSWFDHVKSWEPLIVNKHLKNVLVIYYEDIHKDPAKTIQRLSDFLGFRPNKSLNMEIADKCMFSQMKLDKEKFIYIDECKHIMFRKGVVGDWKNWFTVAQSEMFDKELGKQMKDSNLVHRYLH